MKQVRTTPLCSQNAQVRRALSVRSQKTPLPVRSQRTRHPGKTSAVPSAATDADNDTLTYSLSGTDADAFSIVSTSGQLQTKAALDYETKSSYTVTASVSDGKGGSDRITVSINVTNVNEIDPPLSERTQQVRDAIVAAAPVNNADDVTDTHFCSNYLTKPIRERHHIPEIWRF